jgi:hypothetical protein
MARERLSAKAAFCVDIYSEHPPVKNIRTGKMKRAEKKRPFDLFEKGDRILDKFFTIILNYFPLKKIRNNKTTKTDSGKTG